MRDAVRPRSSRLALGAADASAATVGASLATRLAGIENAADAGTVIGRFHAVDGLDASHLDASRNAGFTRGLTLDWSIAQMTRGEKNQGSVPNNGGRDEHAGCTP